MNFDFRVASPKDDERMVRMETGVVDAPYRGRVGELPLPEMKRQEMRAVQGKRGVRESTRDQILNSSLADQVRAIYDNRNHPG